jgi:hypothetical protein
MENKPTDMDISISSFQIFPTWLNSYIEEIPQNATNAFVIMCN